MFFRKVRFYNISFLRLLLASGVAIGGGWQVLVAYINLGCYYVFGLPLGFLLGYILHWGVEVNFPDLSKCKVASNKLANIVQVCVNC